MSWIYVTLKGMDEINTMQRVTSTFVPIRYGEGPHEHYHVPRENM